jgi:hypothetical protein
MRMLVGWVSRLRLISVVWILGLELHLQLHWHQQQLQLHQRQHWLVNLCVCHCREEWKQMHAGENRVMKHGLRCSQVWTALRTIQGTRPTNHLWDQMQPWRQAEAAHHFVALVP